jgi:preprotein translocase subunit SecB
MAENQAAENNAQQPEQAQPEFAIQRIYLKDASLEMPNSPEIFLAQESPNIDIQLEVSEKHLASNELWEVVVRATVTAKTKVENEERVVFLVECKQAGIFLIRNIPQEQIPMILGITCPSNIYPYLRSSVSDLLVRAGMPPVYLGEVNFEAYFAQRMAALQQESQQAPKQ